MVRRGAQGGARESQGTPTQPRQHRYRSEGAKRVQDRSDTAKDSPEQHKAASRAALSSPQSNPRYTDLHYPRFGFSPSRWTILEPSWRRLGPSWACLGTVLDHQLPILGLSWGILGASQAVSGLYWAMLALSWACLGPSWHPLAPSGSHLEPS